MKLFQLRDCTEKPFLCAIGVLRSMGVMVLMLAILLTKGQAQQTPPAQAASQPANSSQDMVAKGKQNFVTYVCYACHGYAAHGSENGPRIDVSQRTLQAFVNFVRKPSRAMPPYRTQEQISDAALAEIYAYLKSLPPPVDAKSIPLLNTD